MKFLALSTFLYLFLTTTANAYELAVSAGAQTTAVSIETAGTSADGGTGFYGGLMGYMDIGDEHYIRAGALLSQRKYSITTLGIKTDIETLSLDVPMTYMILINEMFGVFGGARLGLNLSDKCDNPVTASCDPKTETMMLAGELGGQFRFTPNIALELAFNLGVTDIANQTKWNNSIVVGGQFLF